MICEILGNDQKTFYDVRDMCAYLYPDEDGIIVLASNVGESFSEFKKKHHEKIICYQLEQLYNYGSEWFNPYSKTKLILERTKHITEWLNGSDEIWDYDLDNVNFLRTLGYQNVSFKPLRWYEGIEFRNKVYRKDIDVLFFGTLNNRRNRYLNQLRGYKVKVIHAGNPVWGEELQDYINRSKIVLNLHYYETCLQEQVRLFRLIGNNCCILSEKSKRNYYGDSITEFKDGELRNKVNYLLRNNQWLKVSAGIGEKFKAKSSVLQ